MVLTSTRTREGRAEVVGSIVRGRTRSPLFSVVPVSVCPLFAFQPHSRDLRGPTLEISYEDRDGGVGVGSTAYMSYDTPPGPSPSEVRRDPRRSHP